MKKITFAIVVIVALVACESGGFETKPELKVTEKNTDVVPNGGTLRVTFEFTDKEGDVDSALFVIRQRLNVNGSLTRPTDRFALPAFPDKNQGEIQLSLTNAGDLARAITPIRIPGSGTLNEPDTLKLSFILADQAGNRSDTASTTVIVIR